jgi:hypothetical protein
MTRLPHDPAARLRGVAAGLLTAALAVAAHGAASGLAPTGAVTVQLALLAATVGALATTITRAHDFRVLLGLLAAGQLLGHTMLSAVGNSHATTTAPPPAAMLAAHAAAVAAGAVLIAAGGRLCAAVSRTVRAVARFACPPIPAPPIVVFGSADQPLRSALLLAASVSHRGPPVQPVR